MCESSSFTSDSLKYCVLAFLQLHSKCMFMLMVIMNVNVNDVGKRYSDNSSFCMKLENVARQCIHSFNVDELAPVCFLEESVRVRPS